MIYRKSDPYPSKYHGRKIQPIFFVYHTTEGGSKQWLDSAFSGTDPNYHYSVHWVAYQDGEVVEYLPWKDKEAVAGWHAGTSEYGGFTSLNYHSIGVEIQHRSGEPYPRVQVEAIKDLSRMVREEWPVIKPVTHAQIAMPRGRKSDPTFPWKDIEPEVLAVWQEDDTMTEDDRNLLKLGRVSDVARSYDMEIIKSMIMGDLEGADELEEAKALELAKVRAALGLGPEESPK